LQKEFQMKSKNKTIAIVSTLHLLVVAGTRADNTSGATIHTPNNDAYTTAPLSGGTTQQSVTSHKKSNRSRRSRRRMKPVDQSQTIKPVDNTEPPGIPSNPRGN